MSFIETIKERAKKDVKTIVLPESMDSRVMAAASKILEEEGFAFPPLLFLPFIVISPRLRRGERWHSLW